MLAIGLSGVYLNHTPQNAAEEDLQKAGQNLLANWRLEQSLTQSQALDIATKITGRADITGGEKTDYMGIDAYNFDAGGRRVLVAAGSGHYWLETALTVELFDPNGHEAGSVFRRDDVFKAIHRSGWIDSTLGTWIADIAGISLAVFSITGLVIGVANIGRNRRNKQTRLGSHEERGAPKMRRLR